MAFANFTLINSTNSTDGTATTRYSYYQTKYQNPWWLLFPILSVVIAVVIGCLCCCNKGRRRNGKEPIKYTAWTTEIHFSGHTATQPPGHHTSTTYQEMSYEMADFLEAPRSYAHTRAYAVCESPVYCVAPNDQVFLLGPLPFQLETPQPAYTRPSGAPPGYTNGY